MCKLSRAARQDVGEEMGLELSDIRDKTPHAVLSASCYPQVPLIL